MRYTKLYIYAGVIFLLHACFGCAQKPSPDDKVLAKVSDSTITLKEFKSKIEKLPPYYRNIVEKNKQRYLEDMIVEKLFYEDAVRKGLNRDREVIEVMNEAKKKIVIAKLITTEVDDKINVTDDEIKQYYDAHKNEFMTPAMWRASHILVSNEREAQDILDALAKGEKFEDLARQRSMDATATRGGDVGYFRLGQLVPEFEKVALKLNVGQLSGIVQTQFGYHIIQLTDKKEPGAESLERAKSKIVNALKKKKRNEIFEKLVMDMKRRYGVEINEDALKTLDTADKEVRPGGKNI